MPDLVLDTATFEAFEAPEQLSAVSGIESHEGNEFLQVRQTVVIVARAKSRPRGGVLRLATIWDVRIFTGRANVQDPDNICSTVLRPTGKLKFVLKC